MRHFAQKLAHLLAQNSHNVVHEDDLRYGIEVMLGGIFQIILLMIAALGLNLFYETAGIIFASGLYRRYSGGAHCTAYYRCTLTSIITFLPLAYLVRLSAPHLNLTVVICTGLVLLLITWLKAPVDNPSNPITDPLRRQSLRQKALVTALVLCLLAVWLLLVSPTWSAAILMGLLWQSITLTAPGHIYMSLWDNIFLYIEKIIRKGDCYAQQS